jgi:outer membrane protein TolC
MKFNSKKIISKNSLKRVFNLYTQGKICLPVLLLAPVFLCQIGCQTPASYRLEADKVTKNIIQKKQIQVLGKKEEFDIERPSDILRRRLLIGQQLPYSGEASLGVDKLKTIEHWPEKDYPKTNSSLTQTLPLESDKPLQLLLLQALQIGARNSFEYQAQKEGVFQSALDLDLERKEFRTVFAGPIESLVSRDLSGESKVTGTETSGSISVSKTLESGVELSAALAVDLVKLLTQDLSSSFGIFGDATIAIPLLRGSGKHIITEPLTQAERNVVYYIYEFERFKKTFAVNIARDYLEVLKRLDQVENASENYRNLIASTRRSRRLADAGRVTEIEVDQALQNELRARNRWVIAQESYKNNLDSFKSLLGLPPDAEIELDGSELDKLLAPTSKTMEDIAREEELSAKKGTPPADALIELVKPNRENAGPFEMDAQLAIELGLQNRFDLRVAEGKVYDAQRKVVVYADALRAELTLFGSAELGESRSIATANSDNAKLRTGKGIYSALLTIDLPFERTAERNSYRNSFISLEQAVRNLQGLEDEIKLLIRKRLRDMHESRESLKIQARALLLAQKRVKSTSLFYDAGRTQIRDLLEAQEALISAKNGLTSAAAAYRIAELEFQGDTGLLKIDEKGLWKEYVPEGIENVKEQ